MRRAAPVLALSVVLACSRDLDVPSSTPPRIDAVALVGLEPQAVVSNLSVLGGELVAIRGGGFPSETAEVEVLIGSEAADVLAISPERIVARVPALGTYGPVDLQVRTAIGFRTQAGALRYDGAGQPSGFGSSELGTSVDLAFVAPIQPPGEHGYSELAIATGASDSALLVVPAMGIAVAAVPLGIVPTSTTAWIQDILTAPRLNVLAVARSAGGKALDASFATVAMSDDGSSLQSRSVLRQLDWSLGDPSPCSIPRVLSPYLFSLPVVTWAERTGTSPDRLATVDWPEVVGSGVLAAYDPAGVHTLDAPIAGWGPWGLTSIVFAAGNEIWSYDAAAPLSPPKVLRIAKSGSGLAEPVSAVLASCGTIEQIYGLATATRGPSEAVAVSYRAGSLDRIALVDLGPGAGTGTVRSGIGVASASLALVPDPVYDATAEWMVLASAGTGVYRFRPAAAAPSCKDLVPDAALALSETPAHVPIGGMAALVDGTRALAITPDGDLVTVLPPSLTSAGPIVRFASYGGVTIQQATVGGQAVPVAIAEHAANDTAISDVDTGSAVLLVSLAGDRGAVALGGSGYGRGAVWLDAPGGGALAYTGDLRATGSSTFDQGGAASVTGIAEGQCPGETVRISSSRPVTRGPDLVLQGPARSGALGPAGSARFGPASPPVYTVKNGALHVYAPEPITLACLAGENGTPNWDPTQPGACAPDATIELGVEPLDVTFSAGDRAAAIRTLEPWAVNPAICRIGDKVCERAQSRPERQLRIVQADPLAPTSTVVPLPAPPEAVAADRGGGFLVTMRCDTWSAPGGGECFSADPLCDQFLTAPGEENGALVLVAEDGSGVECLSVQQALAGPVAVTPNGAEAWITGTTAGGQFLVRLGLPRRTSDGGIDASRPADLVAIETLYLPPGGSGAPPPGGVAFTTDGATAIVTVPAQYRIVLRE